MNIGFEGVGDKVYTNYGQNTPVGMSYLRKKKANSPLYASYNFPPSKGLDTQADSGEIVPGEYIYPHTQVMTTDKHGDRKLIGFYILGFNPLTGEEIDGMFARVFPYTAPTVDKVIPFGKGGHYSALAWVINEYERIISPETFSQEPEECNIELFEANGSYYGPGITVNPKSLMSIL